MISSFIFIQIWNIVMENRLLNLIIIFLLLSSPSTFAIEVAKHLTTIVDPVPIKRISPKYPIEAARSGKSGWAKLSFVIKENGRVGDVVINEVVGDRSFGQSAKQAIKKWKYSPAMENGKPIQQCVNTIQMDFKMVGNGVSKGFQKKYQKALVAIDEENYPLLKELLESMSKYEHGYLNEINLYHNIAAIYAEKVGDKKSEYYHLNRIDSSGTKKEGEKYKLAILNKKFYLSVKLNQFRETFNIYKELSELDTAKLHMKTYEGVIAKVDAFIGGDQDIVNDADIEDKDFWQYPLVRNEFSLVNIKGSLSKLDIRCANKRHVYTVEDNNTWKLPDSWKNCSVLVYGDDNTSFKLIEHPIKS